MNDEPGRAGTAVSVVIPAHNEENGIGAVLAALEETLRNADVHGELIVVDDGSTDGTAEAVRQSSARLIRHETNLGYGAALKTGIREARHDIVCITDADGTYPNETIPVLLERFLQTDCDMLVGARTGENVAIPLVRRPAKWAINKLAHIVVGKTIPDLNSGLRIFRRETVKRFFPLLPDGFSFTTTITLAMFRNGYGVEYVPIDYRPRVGKSKIRPIQDTLNFAQLVLRIALYFAPLRLFSALSAFLILLGVGWGVFSHYILGRLADVSTLVIVVTGIQVAILGLLAELINHRVPNTFRRDPE